MPGSDYCLFHSPDKAKARAEGRRRGGKARMRGEATLPADAPDAQLGTMQELAAYLALTVNRAAKGTLGVRVANAIAGLAGQLQRCLERGDLERRLVALEERAKGGRP
jgi:hypothetical protein